MVTAFLLKNEPTSLYILPANPTPLFEHILEICFKIASKSGVGEAIGKPSVNSAQIALRTKFIKL